MARGKLIRLPKPFTTVELVGKSDEFINDYLKRVVIAYAAGVLSLSDYNIRITIIHSAIELKQKISQGGNKGVN